mmetsp:Transcript_70921/g.217356  ORF Transcript_70921/g.217356 Transcript_70921/m.217356 type:complete len:234 (+) Transcript_70921:405-1106(+)
MPHVVAWQVHHGILHGIAHMPTLHQAFRGPAGLLNLFLLFGLVHLDLVAAAKLRLTKRPSLHPSPAGVARRGNALAAPAPVLVLHARAATSLPWFELADAPFHIRDGRIVATILSVRFVHRRKAVAMRTTTQRCEIIGDRAATRAGPELENFARTAPLFPPYQRGAVAMGRLLRSRLEQCRRGGEGHVSLQPLVPVPMSMAVSAKGREQGRVLAIDRKGRLLHATSLGGGRRH